MYSKNLTIALFILSVPSLQRLLLQWSTEGVWGTAPTQGWNPCTPYLTRARNAISSILLLEK
jgi:hypothetical protein